MPALAARLTGDASTAGGLYAAIAAGAIGGAALLPRLHGRVAPATLVYAGGAAQGVGFVALGVLPVSPLHVALCVACGVPQGLALAALFAVRIECTPPGMRAQVFTSAAGMKAGFGAAGAAASGVLVAAHGFGLALALAGAGLVGATAVGMLAGMASLAAMPIYDYRCRECDERFDELARNPDVKVACPACGAADAERLLSVFAGVGGSSREAAAPDWSRVAAKRAANCGPGCGCHH